MQRYTSEEVSEYLRLSLRTIQRLLQNKTLPAYKIHGQYRIKGLDLLHYLDDARQDLQHLSQNSSAPIHLAELLNVQALALEFGQAWLQEIDSENSGALLNRLEDFRKQLIKKLGFILPGLHLSDNLELPEQAYRVCLQGVPLFQTELDPQAQFLGCAPSIAADALRLPYLSESAFQIQPDGPLKPLDILLLQLESVIQRHAHEILSRDEVAVILDKLRSMRPAVVEEVMCSELTPEQGGLRIGQLTQILRLLLQEQVSIRNMGLILELLADRISQSQDPLILLEHVRQGLSRQINAPLLNAEGCLEVMALDPELESQLREQIQQNAAPLMGNWVQKFQQALMQAPDAAALLCSAEIRRTLFEALSRKQRILPVLSYQEVAFDNRVKLCHSLKFEI